MSLGQAFFIKFVLYLPKWTSSDNNVAPCKLTKVCNVSIEGYNSMPVSHLHTIVYCRDW